MVVFPLMAASVMERLGPDFARTPVISKMERYAD
jgi:hypothetical protein